MDFLRITGIAIALLAASLSGCTALEHHDEADGFVASPDSVGDMAADPLTWCQPAGFDRPVPASVCREAMARSPQPSIEALDAQRKAIQQCVDQVASSGYVQKYPGDVYSQCTRATPVQ